MLIDLDVVRIQDLFSVVRVQCHRLKSGSRKAGPSPSTESDLKLRTRTNNRLLINTSGIMR